MAASAPSLSPREFLRSIDASRATGGKRPIKILDLVDRVRALSGDAPYAVIGGLAQILWARKTHTDDIDLVLAAADLSGAFEKVRQRRAAAGWRLPKSPDLTHESDRIFEVYHLLYRGSVVDRISFHDAALTAAILATARAVPALGGVRFIQPELLLVTHLLRPGPIAALAAVELVLARRAADDFDADFATRWAIQAGRGEALRRTLARADEFGATESD